MNTTMHNVIKLATAVFLLNACSHGEDHGQERSQGQHDGADATVQKSEACLKLAPADKAQVASADGSDMIVQAPVTGSAMPAEAAPADGQTLKPCAET